MKAERWGGYSGYDRWFARGQQRVARRAAAYNDLVPAFERLFEREGGDFERFYAEVRRLAALPPGSGAPHSRAESTARSSDRFPKP